MNILFALTHVPNPRINKRIQTVRSLGTVTVVCIRRSDQDVYEPAVDGVPHQILKMDLPTGEQPVKRLIVSFRFAKSVWQAAKQVQPDILYTVSLDSLLISRIYQLFYRAVRIVYEVADVRESYLKEHKGLRRRLLTFLEKRLYPHVSLLLLTSNQFYEQYYNRYFGKDNTLIIHNMPDISAFETYQKKQSGPFTVGFIGGIRYLNQMKMLVDAADQAGVEVLFAGAGGTTEDSVAIQAYCRGKSHVTFTGKYQYDRDIAGLYSRVDCVYAVYDADNHNVRIALPNKLYEAVFCRLPIIVAKGTYLADVVTDWGVGIATSHIDTEQLRALLSRLSTDAVYYQELVENCRKFSGIMDDAANRLKLIDALQSLGVRT